MPPPNDEIPFLQKKDAPNLLGGDFKATGLNQKWVIDITEFRLIGENLYLSTIMDLSNREIIAYIMSYSLRYPFVGEMLNQTILYSDQGWQFRTLTTKRREYWFTLEYIPEGQLYRQRGHRELLHRAQSELLYLKRFEDMVLFKWKLVRYIDYYNHHRIKTQLKKPESGRIPDPGFKGRLTKLFSLVQFNTSTLSRVHCYSCALSYGIN